MLGSKAQLLKTRQVAEALGLSVSTVKRLVDSGELVAARTVGKHRLIEPGEALRFARDRKLPVAALERLSATSAIVVSQPGPITEIDAQTRSSFERALRRGRHADAKAIAIDVHERCGGAIALGDNLIRPVMEQIGHAWEQRELDVFQEHRATRIVEHILIDLNWRFQQRFSGPEDSTRPLAVGAAPEDDPYTLAGLLCELTLRERGWNVINLGANLPLDSLAMATEAHRPRLVWLNISYLDDPNRFVEDYQRFHARVARIGSAILLGGQALDSDLRSRLTASAFGERLTHLAEFARLLHPHSSFARGSEDPPALSGTDPL